MKTIAKFKCDEWDCKIKINNDGGEEDGAALFLYERNGEDFIGFKFTMLSEVGEFLIPVFKRKIREAGFKIKGSIDHIGPPHISDRIVPIVRKKQTNKTSAKMAT